MTTPRSSRPLAVWLTTGALLAAGASVAVHAAAAPAGSAPANASAGALAAPVPVVTSENVSLETITPILPAAISLEFARTGDFAYASSLTGITVLDISNPLSPQPRGFLPTVNFENEAMTYGERMVDGELRRFVLLAVDLVEVGPQAPGSINLGGMEIVVVDVTDGTNPYITGRGPATTSTHTAQCVDQADCQYVYTAGDSGKFSVVEITEVPNAADPDQPAALVPVERATPVSPASGPDRLELFGAGSGHYWDFDGALGWHTGSGGAAAFDVSNPLAPLPVTATNAQGRAEGLNDFILHNSMRPNAEAFKPGAPASVENGNVLLVTEEDYFNDGDEVVCERSGSFQTWYVPDLDGAAYRDRSDDGALQDKGTVRNLDSSNVPAEFGGGLSAPVGAFCSAHWFDYHQDGFVAQGFYQAGLRILDVRDATNIQQFGYATTGATEVWDAYWVPERDDAGVVTGEKTNIVYTADATRGIDVYSVALPSTVAQPTAPPSDPPATPSAQPTTSAGTGTGTGSTGTTRTGTTTAARSLPATGAGYLLPALSVVLLGLAAVVRRRA